MNDVKKNKSYRFLKFITEIGFWFSIIFFTGAMVFYFISVTFGWSINSFTFSLSYFSGFEVFLYNEYINPYLIPFSLAVGSVTSIIVLWVFRGIIRSVGDGSPFTYANVRRIQTSACSLLVQSYGFMAINYFVVKSLRVYFEQAGLQSVFSERVSLIPNGAVIAFCLFFLAEVFKYGCILQKAYDTTV